MKEETGVSDVELEQLAAFGDPGRDPRGWTVSEAGFRSRSANSWLLGRRLKGTVRTTIAAGRLVYAA